MTSRRYAGRLAAALAVLLLVLPLASGCGMHTPTDDAAFAELPPPAERPGDWPVLPREGGEDGYEDNDPLEGMNRVFFYVNGALDWAVFSPLAQFYRAIVPEEGREAVSRVFTNMAEPVVAANHALQLDFERAGNSLGRFGVNTTVGVLGIFDMATDLGLPADDADFGQTLHHYGVGDGPYVVVPFFGPYSTRDAVGFGVDAMLDPRTYLLEPAPRMVLGLAEGIVRREELIDPIDFLSDHAVDHYDAVRAWTYQRRQRELTGGCTEPIYVTCPGYQAPASDDSE